MKKPNLDNLVIDVSGTEKMRKSLAQTRKVKITINVDEESLMALKEMSRQTGSPYQRILNQILREGILKRDTLGSRLDRIEKELAKLKKKLAA